MAAKENLTTIPESVREVIRGFMLLGGYPFTPEGEADFIRRFLILGQLELDAGTSPNPGLLTENLKWFKVRLDELGAGDVRA